LVIFFIPIVVNVVHDFLNHEHTVCTSKIEQHFHEKNIDCKLHLIKDIDSSLASNEYNLLNNVITLKNVNTQYNFLKNHYQLSFSLRGPPSKI